MTPSALQGFTPSALQSLTPALQVLAPGALQGLPPNVIPPQNNHGHTGPASSLDEMFSRKRGRPPKNRVVEVWADHVCISKRYSIIKILILFFN